MGGPGVGLAHVKRVGGIGAELPGWVQAVKVAPLVDCSGGVGVVASEALVGVAVVDDGLWGVRAGCAGCIGSGTLAGCWSFLALAEARASNALSGFFFQLVNVALRTSLWWVLKPMDSIICARSFTSSMSITLPPKLLRVMAAE